MDTILFNGRVATLDPANPAATAVAIENGVFAAVGDDQQVMARRGPKTIVIDLQGRSEIPGLNDNHAHVIRGRLNYNLELRWDGVASLADALSMLRDQARRTPAPQPVRVVGGGAKANGVALGAQAKLIGADVKVIVLENTGHWILEERRRRRSPRSLISFNESASHDGHNSVQWPHHDTRPGEADCNGGRDRGRPVCGCRR